MPRQTAAHNDDGEQPEPSIHQREADIIAERHRAAAELQTLQADLHQLTGQRRSHMLAGRYEHAREVSERIAELEPQVATLTTHHGALEAASHEINLDRQRTDWRAKIDKLKAQRDEEQRAAHDALAAAQDKLTEATEGLRSALTHENISNNAAAKLHELRFSLARSEDPTVELSRFSPSGGISNRVYGTPMLQALVNGMPHTGTARPVDQHGQPITGLGL